MIKVLILCTGNSCRSKMAQACLQRMDAGLYVRSAGTRPAQETHPLAIQVMEEVGMPITDLQPHNVREYTDKEWDYVITVCDHAREACPFFAGKVANRLHIGFPDPAESTGTEEQRLTVFREVRDQIIREMSTFYHQHTQQ